jgi:hypothetical protein
MGEKYLGLGDILFFLVPMLFFAPANFVVFFMGSLVLSMLAFVLIKVSFKKRITIPLAGVQALMMLGYIASIQVNWLPEFNNDAWVLR